ncbi:PaaI family thioesterase [Qipengyuania flava]|uniref:PaaI family thioesterase n=1 Tax=Qipengyuania flava TaxID=192812 RepID=UPI001C63328C|nr:PaaI family thioesterase [Qipengyuania flava]QYJ06742.1 PaaI family thioesterase [Qipengyuania flava]
MRERDEPHHRMTSAEFAAWWRDLPLAPSEKVIGTRLLECDRDARRVELAFDAPKQFANARGTIQGGFVAALLDTCLGIPVLLASDTRFGPVTLNLSVNYLGAIKPGALRGSGRVTKIGRSVAFVEAELTDMEGNVLATATQTAKLFRRPGTPDV